MGEEDSGEQRRGWWRWRPVLVYGFIIAVVLGLGYSFGADMLVTRYIKEVPRNPETGVMLGFEPIERGDKDSTKAVLMVHGFIGAPDCFNELPDAVAEAGWYVHSMLVPGHGTTPRDFETTSAQDMIDGVQVELAALQAEYETVVIVGHSMGGALSALATAELQPQGLVLVAPLFGSKAPVPMAVVRTCARVVAPVLRWIPGRPGGAPVALKENRSKILHYSWIPMQGAISTLAVEELANTPEVLDKIQCPVLLMHSTGDFVTSAKKSQKAVEAMASEDKTVVIFNKSNHVINWDYDADAAKEAVVKFLGKV